MEPRFRSAFNAAYTPEFYERYLSRLEKDLEGKVPFRVAETPLFLPKGLRDRLASHARAIVGKICDPTLIDHMTRAVPMELDVPRRDRFANCIQVDFAITRGADGELDGKLVELQGFPSLYAYTIEQVRILNEFLGKIPGLDRTWTACFGGIDRETYIAKLRRALLAGFAPEEVVLMDIDPPSQKTSPDFVATRKLLGIDAVDPRALEKDGRRLVRKRNGKTVPVRRIYNRVVFDELMKKGVTLPFSYTEDLDVSWCPHPNWYWIWSKYTIPFVEHPSVPKARFLSEVKELPPDLDNYVLKPLFSFAGSGVKVDVTPADVAAIPDGERTGWLLQEKIHYAPDLVSAHGHGVKAEVRMMFLRAPDQETPELVINLARLSRGKLLGVDQNRDFDWVGGTVGIWPEGE